MNAPVNMNKGIATMLPIPLATPPLLENEAIINPIAEAESDRSQATKPARINEPVPLNPKSIDIPKRTHL